MTTAIIPKNDFPTGDAQEHKKATPKASSKIRPCDSPHTEVLHVESTGVSQCDSEGADSCVDWVLSPLSIPDLKFVDGRHVTLAKTKSHSAKSPRTKTLSDSVEICVDDVRGILKTHLTIPPEAKCSPIESDDSEESVRFLKGPTKGPTNRTAILKGLKSLVAGRTNRKRRREKCLSSSESEDGRDDLPVLQKGSRVKEPPQIVHDSEINEEYPCMAGAEECVSNCRLPRYSVQMPHDQIEPLKLVKLNYTLSQEMKKTIQGNLDNRHPRKKMRDRRIPSDTCTMLGLNMEINALNTGHHVMPSKPTSVSKGHLIMLKELKSAAHQKNTNNSTASTEPSRIAIAGGTELSRAASAGGTASGRKPCRDASASGHATPSPMETSPSSTYSRCLTTTSRKRISHYPKEQASPRAQHMASSGDSISRSTYNNSASKHQKPCSQQGPSTSPASRSQKEQLNSSKIPSKHHFPSKQGTSSETKVSAREQVKNMWQSTNFLKDPEKQQQSRKELKRSSVPEGHQHISTSKAASVSKPNNAGKWAGMELHSNVAKQKDTSFKCSLPTSLVTRARIQAKEWTRATHREGLNKSMPVQLLIYTFVFPSCLLKTCCLCLIFVMSIHLLGSDYRVSCRRRLQVGKEMVIANRLAIPIARLPHHFTFKVLTSYLLQGCTLKFYQSFIEPESGTALILSPVFSDSRRQPSSPPEYECSSL